MERTPKKIIIDTAKYDFLVSEERKKIQNVDTNQIIKDINQLLEAYQFPITNTKQEDIKENDELPEIHKEETHADKPSFDSSKVANLISQMRKLSLEGIALLADSVDAPEYDIFKRIWTICEKHATSNKKQENQ